MDQYDQRRWMRHGLHTTASLAAAFVRNALQYGEYGWASVWQFLGFWPIHYFALLIGGLVFYVVLIQFRKRLLDADETPSPEDGMTYFALAVLVISALVFIVAHWPASGELDS